MKTWNAFIGV